MKDYWKSAPDVEIDTGRNIFRYYAEAARLQVCMPYWTNKDGERQQGKTVAINLQALAETPEAVELLNRILDKMA